MSVKLLPVKTRPKCLYCDKPLRAFPHRDEEWNSARSPYGDYGDGLFCGLTCGWSWAVSVAPRYFALSDKGARFPDRS